jgi:hypothetical protein
MGRLLLRGPWRGKKWHGHRDRPIKERHGLLAHHRIDRLEGSVMHSEDLV